MTIDEYRRGIPTHQDKGKTIGMLCETKERCITDDDGTVLTDKLAGLRQYTDNAYANSNLYTDTKIGELINGAPTTLDTLKEIADAMEENADVVEALDKAVGSKVDQAEYDGHADNGTIHITAEERAKWNSNSGGSADTLGGETAEAWQTKIDSIQTTSRATLSTAGWYRVAEYVGGSSSSMNGSRGPSCEVDLKRSYAQGYGSEYHLIRVSGVTSSFKLTSYDDNAYKQLITNARLVVDTSTYTMYLEIYFSGTISNTCYASVRFGADVATAWKAIDFVPTSDTVDGVTVTTTYDIPANASPVTDLDLVQATGTLLTTSILEKALEVDIGGYFYHNLGGSAYTGGDLPSDAYAYGSASIFRRDTSKYTTVILWGRSGGHYPQINYYNSGTWSGWNKLATTVDLANYLPKDGTATSTVSVIGYQGGSNVNRHVWFSDNSDETKRNYDDSFMYNPNTKTLTATNINGTATGNLPLSGGQIDSTSHVPLKLNSTNTENEYSTIAFLKGGTEYGRLGMYGKDTPIFRMADNGSVKRLLHEGNSAKCVVVDTDPGVGASVSYADGTLIFVKE